jgi:hypothetical protein
MNKKQQCFQAAAKIAMPLGNIVHSTLDEAVEFFFNIVNTRSLIICGSNGRLVHYGRNYKFIDIDIPGDRAGN